MSDQNAVVAVYGTHVEAEEAVKELQRAGTDMAHPVHRWQGFPHR